MNRADKIILLNKVLQGETSTLLAVLGDQRKPDGIFIISDYPPGWFDHPESEARVRTRYLLTDGTRRDEWLTYADIRAKAGLSAAIMLLPHNPRNHWPESPLGEAVSEL